MRIAVLKKDKCTKGEKCEYVCQRFCPRVRAGDETIKIGEDGYPIIDETTCIGCGICVKKCPTDAITIVNIPQELSNPVHQFGMNGFRLFGLPIPKEGQVVGLLGPNGTGKTTVLSILSGELVPNMGNLFESSWDAFVQSYAGTELHDYLKATLQQKRVSVKPQHIVGIPKVYKGTVRELLEKVDQRGILRELSASLDLGYVMDKEVGKISGGELQRVAIAACLSKDADTYFIDEPSSYLDLYQRLNAAKAIRAFAKGRILVVEHDLVVLDYLSDIVHIFYGKPGAYGIVSGPKSSRVGINAYLDGYLKEENVRFREEPLVFKPHQPFEVGTRKTLTTFHNIKKTLGTFVLETKEGEFQEKEVVGVVGPNGIGKTTFVKVLAGLLKSDAGDFGQVRVAYKPQYLEPTGQLVGVLLNQAASNEKILNFDSEVIGPLGLREMRMKKDNQLSGGELQRLAIALTLASEADLYLFDEPSAFLDVEQRMNAAKILRRAMEKKSTTALVVDHDLMLVDYLSDRVLVFLGTPGTRGDAFGPLKVRDGMNQFLSTTGITFRRDLDSKRPRANKEDSKLDREQKSAGEYYHTLQ